MTQMPHFVTGGTGFVGAALVLELLARTSGVIHCLVRPSTEDAPTRLHRALHAAADAYAVDAQVKRAIAERCRAVPGDVEKEGCGVEGGFECDQLWHVAASLRYENRYVDEINRVNVDGTRHALELASRLGTRHFNHVSTAYVAGGASGHLLEVPSGPDSPTNNLYERSKVMGEALVAKAVGFGRRIFRPSIVIGHSDTLGATTFSGMYGFIRNVFILKGLMERTQKGLLARKPLMLHADAEAEVNLVPVDRVVANAVTIALATDPDPGDLPEYYHLTNPSAPTVGATIDVIFETLGLPTPRYSSDTKSSDWLDTKVDRRIEFFRSYMAGFKTFDRTNALRHVQSEPLDAYRLLPDALDKHCSWYIERLQRERSSLRPAR
jgi:nucleoside-diphosphate-sugar epimerase